MHQLIQVRVNYSPGVKRRHRSDEHVVQPAELSARANRSGTQAASLLVAGADRARSAGTGAALPAPGAARGRGPTSESTL